MELENLLFRIRDANATAEELLQARELVSVDVRLPQDLREVADFSEDPVGDAVGLLAVLGADNLFGEVLREGVAADLAGPAAEASNREDLVLDEVWPLGEVLAEAVRFEAGEVELTAVLFESLGLEDGVFPLAAAVRQEAGEIELIAALFGALGLEEVEVPVAAAVHDEAGEGVVWPAVEAAVGGSWVSAMVDGELDAEDRQIAMRQLREHPEAGAQMTAFASLGSDIRAAVRDEMGEVPYLWGGVAGVLGFDAEAVPGWDGALVAEAIRAEAGGIDIAAAVMDRAVTLPSMVEEPEPLPEPANSRRWGGVLMAMAAAAVLLVAVPTAWNESKRGEPTIEVSSVQFASAGEIVVENLAYGENSKVHQVMGDEGALILWVDEGSVK